MYVIDRFNNEKGAVLLNTLLFMMFLGIMGITMATLVIADSKMQVININERQAFYAAQSGLEYGIRGVMEYAVDNSNLSSLHNYRETIITGNGSQCEVRINVMSGDRIQIIASGKTGTYSRTLRKTIDYIDVSNYAIYTTGQARYIRTFPPNLIYENAQYMPKFDLNELRDLARPLHYYSGNLTINHVFTFSQDVMFIEGDLSFGQMNWYNYGSFVVRGDVLIQTSWFPLGSTNGVIYQPEAGSRFLSQWNFLWRSLRGGIISNGDVIGTTRPWWMYRFWVIHDRDRINDFMQYSVNGGPLIITSSRWEN